MGRYTLRKEKGAKRPFTKNPKEGYALFLDGRSVYPKYRNWWPNKTEANKNLEKAKKTRKRRGRRLMLTFDDIII